MKQDQRDCQDVALQQNSQSKSLLQEDLVLLALSRLLHSLQHLKEAKESAKLKLHLKKPFFQDTVKLQNRLPLQEVELQAFLPNLKEKQVYLLHQEEKLEQEAFKMLDLKYCKIE